VWTFCAPNGIITSIEWVWHSTAAIRSESGW
jgi:hypothetical protein